jgi:hypothetical protein
LRCPYDPMTPHLSAPVRFCRLSFIGQMLDKNTQGDAQPARKLLKSLALPRGIEPLFSP